MKQTYPGRQVHAEDHPEAYYSPSQGYIVRGHTRSAPDEPEPLVRASDHRVVHELPEDSVKLSAIADRELAGILTTVETVQRQLIEIDTALTAEFGEAYHDDENGQPRNLIDRIRALGARAKAGENTVAYVVSNVETREQTDPPTVIGAHLDAYDLDHRDRAYEDVAEFPGNALFLGWPRDARLKVYRLMPDA